MVNGAKLRTHHFTALMVLSIAAFAALIATGYFKFLFLTMPCAFIFNWARQRRKLASSSAIDVGFPTEHH